MKARLAALPRPTVKVGHVIYEIIEPHDLRAIVDELTAEIYGRAGLTPAERDRRFALELLAASVNALRELDRRS